jgi:hypothetical protein
MQAVKFSANTQYIPYKNILSSRLNLIITYYKYLPNNGRLMSLIIIKVTTSKVIASRLSQLYRTISESL